MKSLALTIAASVIVSQVAFGQGHQFVITETSSTSLTVTYDGTPLTVSPVPGTTDQWSFILTPGFRSTEQYQWAEPENSLFVNLVSFFATDVTHQAFVSSDANLLPALSPHMDGDSIKVGTDGGIDVFAMFTDNAARSEGSAPGVPDSGSTFGLLLLSFGALIGVSRFRSLRLA